MRQSDTLPRHRAQCGVQKRPLSVFTASATIYRRAGFRIEKQLPTQANREK